MPELDLLEPPVDAEEQEHETPDGDGETPEGEQSGEGEGEKDGEGDDGKPAVTSLFQPDGKKLDPTVSAALQKLKAENPSLGKLLTKSMYRIAELDREFPGGVAEARELRDKVEEFGGVQAIEEKIAGLAEMDGLAKQFMDGDPAFVDDLIESSKEGFAAIAPVVFAKYAELHPDGFGAYLGRIVYQDLVANEVPLLMMRLQDCIGALDKNENAVEAFKLVNSYLGAFKALANKPMPEVKKSTATPKNDDHTRREEELRAREWKLERDTAQRTIMDAEYSRALAGRKPSAEEKLQIRELFTTRGKSAADRMFPGWAEKAQRFITANDKAGYLRYMKSIYARVVPEAMQSAVASTLRGAKKPAVNGQRPVVKAVANGQQQNGGGSAYAPVAKEPSTWDIDFNRTNQGMLMGNKAILKDGRRVTWKDK